jgi:hypothetical protein
MSDPKAQLRAVRDGLEAVADDARDIRSNSRRQDRLAAGVLAAIRDGRGGDEAACRALIADLEGVRDEAKDLLADGGPKVKRVARAALEALADARAIEWTPAPPPELTVRGFETVTPSASAPVEAAATLALSAPAAGRVTAVVTLAGLAAADLADGRLSFTAAVPAGETSAPLPIRLAARALAADKAGSLALSAPSGARLGSPAGFSFALKANQAPQPPVTVSIARGFERVVLRRVDQVDEKVVVARGGDAGGLLTVGLAVTGLPPGVTAAALPAAFLAGDRSAETTVVFQATRALGPGPHAARCALVPPRGVGLGPVPAFDFRLVPADGPIPPADGLYPGFNPEWFSPLWTEERLKASVHAYEEPSLEGYQRLPEVASKADLDTAIANVVANGGRRIIPLKAGLHLPDFTLAKDVPGGGQAVIDGQIDIPGGEFRAGFAGDLTVTGDGWRLRGLEWQPIRGGSNWKDSNRLRATVDRLSVERCRFGSSEWYERQVSLSGTRREVLFSHCEWLAPFDHGVWAADSPHADCGIDFAWCDFSGGQMTQAHMNQLISQGKPNQGSDASVYIYSGNNVATNPRSVIVRTIAFTRFASNVGRGCVEFKSAAPLMLNCDLRTGRKINLRGTPGAVILACIADEQGYVSVRGSDHTIIGLKYAGKQGEVAVSLHAGNYDDDIDGMGRGSIPGGHSPRGCAVRPKLLGLDLGGGVVAAGDTESGDTLGRTRPMRGMRAAAIDFFGQGLKEFRDLMKDADWRPAAPFPSGLRKVTPIELTDAMVGPFGTRLAAQA